MALRLSSIVLRDGQKSIDPSDEFTKAERLYRGLGLRLNNRSAGTVIALLTFIALSTATRATATRAEAPRVQIVDSTPALSVESIYHPKNRFKYIQSPTPATRWAMSSDGRSLLRLKRSDGWKQLDPRDGVEVPDTWEGTLIAQLRTLDGVDEKKAKTVAQSLLADPKFSLDAGLAPIDESIAIFGSKEICRWITPAGKTWQEVSLSPDAKQVAFVEANDLYVMQLSSGRVSRVTTDGSSTQLNGILDWVYQEEVYGRGNHRGYWWRGDSSAIAFLKLDSSKVTTFTVTGSKRAQGETFVERYPKAGDPIPQVELWCVKLSDHSPENEMSVFPLLNDALSDDTLITRVGWQDKAGKLIVQTSNRLQNDVSLLRIDIDEPSKKQVLLREQCDKWLEVQELPRSLTTGEYLRLSDLPVGRRRLWRISADGTNRWPLTPEDFDVREILHVDAKDQFAIVTGDRQRGTVGQHLYRIALLPYASDAANWTEPVRLTDDAPWHVASISDDGQWMVDRSSSISQPVSMWLRSLESPTTVPPRLLNQEMMQLKEAPAEVTWHSISADDGVTLPACFVSPKSNAVTDSKFPVLIEIYGGPLTPTVRDGWMGNRYLLHQMLASEGIGVLVVDNRSSGGRGLADSWSIHRKMGEVETRDLVTATDWLCKQPGVDKTKIALRGWSFGGYLTLQAMTHSDRFAAGIAGGSVTDWRNYDAIYTERYMSLPDQNLAGYDLTSPVLAADKIHGRVLMLHGEVDDNVHLANTMQMAAALQKAGKTFDMMIYPGAAHAVHDPSQDFHLMQTTLEFLRREFSPKNGE